MANDITPSPPFYISVQNKKKANDHALGPQLRSSLMPSSWTAGQWDLLSAQPGPQLHPEPHRMC